MVVDLSSKRRQVEEAKRKEQEDAARLKAKLADYVVHIAEATDDEQAEVMPPDELLDAIGRNPEYRLQPVWIPYRDQMLLALVDGAGWADPRTELVIWRAIRNPPQAAVRVGSFERAALPWPLLGVARHGGGGIVLSDQLSRRDALAAWRLMRTTVRGRGGTAVTSFGALAALAVALRHFADTTRAAASAAAASGLVSLSAAAAVITAPMAPGVVGQPASMPSVERTTPVDKAMPLPPRKSAKTRLRGDAETKPAPPLPIEPPPPAPVVRLPPVAALTAPLSAEPTAKPETTGQPQTEEAPAGDQAEPAEQPAASDASVTPRPAADLPSELAALPGIGAGVAVPCGRAEGHRRHKARHHGFGRFRYRCGGRQSTVM